MDIKIGDKVRFNQLGLDTPPDGSSAWCCIVPDSVNKAKRLGTGTIIQVTRTHGRDFLLIDFQGSTMPLLYWPAEFFEKVPEEEKPELTQEEKELLRELVQDKLKGYQELLDKLR